MRLAHLPVFFRDLLTELLQQAFDRQVAEHNLALLPLLRLEIGESHVLREGLRVLLE